jgi:hypothetical protein
MRKKGKRGYIEYIQPVSLDDRPTDVEILYIKYNPNQDKYEHTEETLSTPLSLCENDLYILQHSDLTVINDFLNALEDHNFRVQETLLREEMWRKMTADGLILYIRQVDD